MKNTNKIYVLVTLLIIFSIVKFVILDSKFTATISSYILMVFWILLCFLSLIMLKYPKDSSLYKKNANKMVVILLMATLLVTYLLGFFVGFVKNGYITSINLFLKSVIPLLFIKVSREVIRYIVAKNSTYKKLPIIITTVVFILFEVLSSYFTLTYIDGEQLFYFISITVLPCIAENLICSYLVYNFGLDTSLLYVLPYSLYSFIIPYLPALGNYINSVVYITLPFLIYMFTIRIVRYQNKEKININQKTRNLFVIPIIVFLAVLAVLVSGLLRYKLIAIASDSMNPVFYRGDGIIYENIKYIEEIEVGDILVFQNSGRIITHRVMGIVDTPEGRIYKTKGDSNNAMDNFDVYERDSIGVVRYVIKFVGYPTVWFSENIKRIIR